MSKRIKTKSRPADDKHTIVKDVYDYRNQAGLLYWSQLPEWYRDNEFLISGYRPISGSVCGSFASLLYLNNQTVNAYSHLIGACAFLVIPLYFKYAIVTEQPGATFHDVAIITLYCWGVATCFTLSAIFHILCNHSQEWALFWNKLDYLGILILQWSAGIGTIYYGLPCDRNWRLIYWTMTTTTAVGCVYATLHPHFSSVGFRHWRACLYAGFGLSSIIYIIHGLTLHGYELQRSRMSLAYMSWMASANFIGGLVYAARIPERWVPYTFDIWGASHQTMHVAVMIAAWIHLRGLIAAFRFVRTHPEMCYNV